MTDEEFAKLPPRERIPIIVRRLLQMLGFFYAIELVARLLAWLTSLIV